MLLILDAMLAVAGLVLLIVAPSAFNWISSTLKENHFLRKVLQVLGSLIIIIPAVSLAISQVQQRSAKLSPEVSQQIGVVVAITWGVMCLITPAAILSCGEWDKKNKEAFRVVAGFFLCVNVALLGWALINEIARIAKQGESVVLVGPLRWAAPVSLFSLVVFDYFMLKLSHRVYPRDEPAEKPVEPIQSVQPVAPLATTPLSTSQVPEQPKPANRRRRRRNSGDASGASTANES